MQKVIKHYKHTAHESLYMKDLGCDPIHDRGNHPTKHITPSNKKLLPQSDDDVWHYNIAYGIGTAIEDIKYALIIIDKGNRYIFAYPLKDSSLLLAMKFFLSQLGNKPKKMFADRDFKFISGVVEFFWKQMTTLHQHSLHHKSLVHQ